MKRFIKQHVRNRSLPDVKQVAKSGLRKDDTTKSALCINGSHLYVPGIMVNVHFCTPGLLQICALTAL